MTATAVAPLPRLCNVDRLLHAMTVRGLDGIMASLPWNVFYLTSLNGVAQGRRAAPLSVVTAREQPQARISTAR